MKVLFYFGLLLAVLGGGFWLQQRRAWNSIQWFPLAKPVLLNSGSVESPRISVSDVRYRMKVDISAGDLEWGKRHCLLGFRDRDSDPPCRDSNPIDFSWTLIKKGTAIRSGHLQGLDEGGGAPARVFGGFTGEKSAIYCLEIHVNRISEELSTLSPRVEIEGVMPEPYSHEISQFFLELVFFVGLLIVIMTSINIVMRRRDELVRIDAEENALPHPQS